MNSLRDVIRCLSLSIIVSTVITLFICETYKKETDYQYSVFKEAILEMACMMDNELHDLKVGQKN